MKIIIGNWKMNGDAATLAEMLDALRGIATENTVIICPPATLLYMAAGAPVAFGAQDVSAHENGAYTGEISAKMIVETGAKYTIVGHSERRMWHGETNDIVLQKATRALENGLKPIICVGETREEKEAGTTEMVIERQLKESIPSCRMSHVTCHDLIVAYEPVWAVSGRGTGLVPTTDDICKIHAYIAGILKSMGLTGTAILYGGSVNGDTAAEIMAIPNVSGVLVGGKSLKPADFLPIVKA